MPGSGKPLLCTERYGLLCQYLGHVCVATELIQAGCIVRARLKGCAISCAKVSAAEIRVRAWSGYPTCHRVWVAKQRQKTPRCTPKWVPHPEVLAARARPTCTSQRIFQMFYRDGVRGLAVATKSARVISVPTASNVVQQESLLIRLDA